MKVETVPPPPRRAPEIRKRFRKWMRSARNGLIGLLGPALVRLWMSTIRIRWCGPGLLSPEIRYVKNRIYVLWHQQMLAFANTHRGRGARTLVSSHGDGEMIARILDRLGFKVIRGSTKRGGVQALKRLLGDLGSGSAYAFTPDGPRGPMHVFHLGAVYFASKSGLAVVPTSVAYARCWRLPTWDRFMLPYPFTRGVVQYGEEIHVPRDLEHHELELWRQRLEETLRTVSSDTEARFEELYGKGITWKEVFQIHKESPSPSSV